MWCTIRLRLIKGCKLNGTQALLSSVTIISNLITHRYLLYMDV